MKKNKKAAFELSVTTMVIIVIAVVLLILGLVFVRQIFGVGTRSVSQVDLQVRNQLQKMLSEEEKDITIYSKEVKVRPGSQFTIPFAARNPEGGSVSELQYKVTLVRGRGDCVEKNGGIDTWFINPPQLNSRQNFYAYEVNVAYEDLVLQIPKGAVLCAQRISIKLIYYTTGGKEKEIADSFTLYVTRGGLF